MPAMTQQTFETEYPNRFVNETTMPGGLRYQIMLAPRPDGRWMVWDSNYNYARTMVTPDHPHGIAEVASYAIDRSGMSMAYFNPSQHIIAEPDYPNVRAAFTWIGDMETNPTGMPVIGILPSRINVCSLCMGRQYPALGEHPAADIAVQTCDYCLINFCNNEDHVHDGEYCNDCGYNAVNGASVDTCSSCDNDFCDNHEYMHEECGADDYYDEYSDHPPVDNYGREASLNYIDNEFVSDDLMRVNRAATVEIEAEWIDTANRDRLSLHPDCGVTGDGSLNNGIEVTLPPSRGKELVDFMQETMSKMESGGYGIKSTCGLHVHIDIREHANNKRFLAHLFNAFYAFEDILYAMQSSARYNNSYSVPLRNTYKFYEMYGQEADKFDFNFYRFEQSVNGERMLENEKRSKYASPRYAAFNFHSTYYRGSLEVRLHEGTLNPTRALRFIELINRMIARVEKGTHSYKFMAKMVEMPVKDKLRHFYRYFSIPQDLQRHIEYRIRAGQGIDFSLPSAVRWGEAKRGRPKKIRRPAQRRPFPRSEVRCLMCNHVFRNAASIMRCPNFGCGERLFDSYGGINYVRHNPEAERREAERLVAETAAWERSLRDWESTFSSTANTIDHVSNVFTNINSNSEF